MAAIRIVPRTVTPSASVETLGSGKNQNALRRILVRIFQKTREQDTSLPVPPPAIPSDGGSRTYISLQSTTEKSDDLLAAGGQ